MIPVRGSISGRVAPSPSLPLRSAPERPAHAPSFDPLVEEAVAGVRLALRQLESSLGAALDRQLASIRPAPSAAEPETRRCAGLCGPEMGSAESQGPWAGFGGRRRAVSPVLPMLLITCVIVTKPDLKLTLGPRSGARLGPKQAELWTGCP